MTDGKLSRGRKLLYMIFSIAISIGLWTYIAYVGNPEVKEPVSISGIQVVLTGEDLLRDSNLIVSSVDVRDLTIDFSGRFREVNQLSSTNIRAVVNLAEILRYPTPTGNHSLNYELEFDTPNSTIKPAGASRTVVEVTVERLVTEPIRLTASYEGSISPGYMAGELTLSRDTVDISGTEAAISRIDRAVVTLTGESLARTTSAEEKIVLYDDQGEEIDMEEAGLSFPSSNGTILITQTVLMVKEVPLKLNIVESTTAKNANTRIEYTPPFITLSGDPEILEDTNEINLGTVNLQSFILSFENDYPIRIPNGTNNLSNVTTATVRITVENVETRRMSAANISYRNAAETDSVSIITQSLDIVLRGNIESLQQITSENISIVAELSELAGSKGTFTAPAKVYIYGFPDVEAVGEYKVTVMIG